MATESAKTMDPLIREIVWRFGAQGIQGECCGDLTAPEFRALRLASAQDKCSMQYIAKELGFTKSGATRVVDRLENRGLLKRMRSTDDGRVCCVELTSAGDSLVKRINQENESRLAKILSKIDPAMRQVLQTSLMSFVQAMNEEGGQGDQLVDICN